MMNVILIFRDASYFYSGIFRTFCSAVKNFTPIEFSFMFLLDTRRSVFYDTKNINQSKNKLIYVQEDSKEFILFSISNCIT